jgi:cell division protein FtsW
MVVGLLIVAAFAFIVLRGFTRLLHEGNYFIVLAAGGLLAQFGLQAFVNMGVNLRLLPAKGMTLPFISYGGSSILALALGMGMVLALTRRRSTIAETRWMLDGTGPSTQVQA